MELANAMAEQQYPSRISLWETGRSLPSESNRVELATVLGVSTETFFAWSLPEDEEDEPEACAA